MSEDKGFFSLPEKNRFELTLAVLFLLGVIACVAFISLADLTSKESGILSLFLTVLSIIASWLLAKIYGDSQHARAIEEVKEMHNEKVRTFALKAAEKVNNLSDQINKLSIYLEEGLDDEKYEEDKECLLAKEQRIESAIHILSMLKSVNDTSLSDWHGVIDEEIESQREAREEREEELRELVHRLESLIIKTNNNQQDEKLVKQIDIMKKDMRLLMAGVSGSHVKVSKAAKRKTRKDLVKECPGCGNELKYTQRSKRNSVKTIYCKHCSSLVYSRYSPDADDFILEIKEERREEILCPDCETKVSFELDTETHTKKSVKCGQCHIDIAVARMPSGEVAFGKEAKKIVSSGLTEEDIENVRNELPPQPWPKDTHKEVANKLGMSNSAVLRSTKELIKRGIFKEQVDGVLYDLVKTDGEDLTS